MLKIGIVGMGVIGRHVAEAASRSIPGVTLVGVTVREPSTATGFPILSLHQLLDRSDLIVEAATQAALREFGPTVPAAGKHLMVLSVVAVSLKKNEWARLGEKHGCRILVPSGAIAGPHGGKGQRQGAINGVHLES